MVHGGNVPIEWSEKNNVVGAPKSIPVASSTKRIHGKSPPLEDKTKKVRRKRATAKKPRSDDLKPQVTVQSNMSYPSC